jgi:phosphatidylinositol alpha 1,6-mannosyltransferase
MGLAARASVEGRSWASVNAALLEHYRDVIRLRDAVRAAAA